VGFGAENGTTTFVQGVTDVTLTAAAGTFLAVQLAAGTLYFRTGFHLVRSLPLSSQVLLNCQINGVVVRLNAEDFFRKLNSSTCFLSLYI
jgi:hypothetical protein